MEILPLTRDHYPQAAELFVRKLKRLRQSIPELPDSLEDIDAVAEQFGRFPPSTPAYVAMQDGRMLGYLAGFVFGNMRGTGRTGAFVPEWGHAALEDEPAVYRQLYSAISGSWAAAGASMHGIALLANDLAALRAWFWNGFGLTVVDGIRSTGPIGAVPPAGWELRPAEKADADAISRMDAEHCRHYSQAPLFMAPRQADDAETVRRFIGRQPNRYWLAFHGGELGGLLRCEPRSEGAAEIVVSPKTIAVDGAFVRPQFRGQGVASALLEAALRDYAAQGFTRCSVDFESFNPQAAALWPRYFHPVTYSAIRVLEWLQPNPAEDNSSR
ncbi:acetyltransferases [Longilinea arvoryzae]|uniref:Acetyltransferases n=1 Tax=Longilinea arvoryzae TaxID=360412 RepID=A0A0S7BFG9_9CHLR|nr:GNAT family N-acetyltransferase [Longilinea arvoryzae]GAP12539.1 acetyltransferases [Longilinea arvoryzae]